MLTPDIALIAYLIDNIFGEFPIKHPVVWMGDFIKLFEKHLYKDNYFRGLLLLLSLITTTIIIIWLITKLIYFISLHYYLNLILFSLIASTGIAHKMLYDSIKNILSSKHPQDDIALLVSRDAKPMTQSDIYKAGIESYSENLSDGVIAPLIYLTLFGLYGLFVYKAVNTLDSMIGYKTTRYKHFGYCSAKLDDILNYIPSRLTAIIILLLNSKANLIKESFVNGSKHTSPNAGYPISAMAYSLNIKLGGPTYYHGYLYPKPFFGTGHKKISSLDLTKSLYTRQKLDITLFILILIYFLIYFLF